MPGMWVTGSLGLFKKVLATATANYSSLRTWATTGSYTVTTSEDRTGQLVRMAGSDTVWLVKHSVVGYSHTLVDQDNNERNVTEANFHPRGWERIG